MQCKRIREVWMTRTPPKNDWLHFYNFSLYVYLHRYTQICYWANRVKPGYSFGARKDTLWSIWCFVFHIYIFTTFLSKLDAVAESSGWYSLMLRGWLARLISSIWERSKCSEIQDQDGSCFKVILHTVDKRLGGCNSYNTFREFLEVFSWNSGILSPLRSLAFMHVAPTAFLQNW